MQILNATRAIWKSRMESGAVDLLILKWGAQKDFQAGRFHGIEKDLLNCHFQPRSAAHAWLWRNYNCPVSDLSREMTSLRHSDLISWTFKALPLSSPLTRRIKGAVANLSNGSLSKVNDISVTFYHINFYSMFFTLTYKGVMGFTRDERTLFILKTVIKSAEGYNLWCLSYRKYRLCTHVCMYKHAWKKKNT